MCNWDINNQESDQIVDISRDHLTSDGRKWLNEQFPSIFLPRVIEKIGIVFDKYIDSNETILESLPFKIQYFHYCLTALSCNLMKYNINILKNTPLPKTLASYNEKGIYADKIFSSNTLFLVTGYSTSNGNNIIESQCQSQIEQKYCNTLKDNLIIWGGQFFRGAFVYNYICTDIIEYDKGCHIYKLEKHNFNDPSSASNTLKPIDCSIGSKYLRKLEKPYIHYCVRNTIHAIKEYPNLIVKNRYITGFEVFPDYSTCCIYSPFSKNQREQLLDLVKDMDESAIISTIREKIPEFFTSSMIETIISDNINKNVNEKDIIEDYVRLICDYIKYKQNEIISSKEQ